jgi:hypothetical protein
VSPFTVNPRLTPHSHADQRRRIVRRRDVANDDYAAFTRRIITAHGRRIAAGDIEGLTDLAALATDIDTALRTAITGLRAAGYYWADIGTRLGMTRQAAQQRFGSRQGDDR